LGINSRKKERHLIELEQQYIGYLYVFSRQMKNAIENTPIWVFTTKRNRYLSAWGNQYVTPTKSTEFDETCADEIVLGLHRCWLDLTGD